MKRLYDTQWHGIPFSSFAKLSYFKLPNALFYKKFYEIFFSKYSGFEDLSAEWKVKKELQGRHILELVKEMPEHANILSVGCGMGYLEYTMLPLIQERNLNLYCYETSETQFRFLQRYIAPRFCLSGAIQKNMPTDVKFDLIYLLTVDYALTNRQFVNLLRTLKRFLASEKSILLVSSLTIEKYEQGNVFTSIKNIRQNLMELLHYIRNDSNIQFWGWRRTVDELLKLCIRSGYVLKEYGTFESIKNLYIKMGLE